MPDDVRRPLVRDPKKWIALHPDLAEIRRAFDAWFRHADPGGVVSLPIFPQEPGAPIANARFVFRDVEALITEAEKLARRAGTKPGQVFCPRIATFHPRDEKRFTDANLACALVIGADLDSGNPPAVLTRLTDVLGQPTLVVHSGGAITDANTGETLPKLHVYWRLAVPARTSEEHAQVKQARAYVGMIAGTALDGTSKSPGHPMRCPGSWHTKDPANPTLCRIVDGDPEREITLADALARLGAASEVAQLSSAHRDATGASARTGDQRRPGRLTAPNDTLVRETLESIPYVYAASDQGQPDWLRVGMAVFNATAGRGLKLWSDWYRAKAPEAAGEIALPTDAEREAECEARWQRIATSPADKLGWPNLRKWAREASIPQGMVLTPKGAMAHCEANLLPALAGPGFPKVGFNLFTGGISVIERPDWDDPTGWNPRPWADADDGRATIRLQQKHGLSWASRKLVRHALDELAWRNRFDPVADYLLGLEWDGRPRLDTWLTDHLGVEDSSLHRAYGSKWLISAVARALRPGCKVDTVLVLEGPQGIGKSTALKTMCGEEHFTDQIPDIRDKDAQAQLQGIWVLEFAEFNALSRAEVSHVKSFITITTDRFRAAYGYRPGDHPRRCVFAATLNQTGDYLEDETGSRRFWPVACAVGWPDDRKVNHAALGAARDQLWAEAVHRFQHGEPWHLSPELDALRAIAATPREREDPWHEAVAVYLRDKEVTTARMIFEVGLMMLAAQPGPASQKRLSSIMQRLGWKRQTVRVPIDPEDRNSAKGPPVKGYAAPEGWAKDWTPPDGWTDAKTAAERRDRKM